MGKSKVKATKLVVGLPFNLGSLEIEPDEVERNAAWELYVELVTRVTTQVIDPGEGVRRESLKSLHYIFDITRQILKKSGPSVAQGPNSFGAIAIEVLNKGIRPFLTEWHPKLLAYEDMKVREYQYVWEYADTFDLELSNLQEQIMVYINVLAKIAGVSVDTKSDHPALSDSEQLNSGE